MSSESFNDWFDRTTKELGMLTRPEPEEEMVDGFYCRSCEEWYEYDKPIPESVHDDGEHYCGKNQWCMP